MRIEEELFALVEDDEVLGNPEGTFMSEDIKCLKNEMQDWRVKETATRKIEKVKIVRIENDDS